MKATKQTTRGATKVTAPVAWRPFPVQDFTNPGGIIEHLENESTGTEEDDPYRKRIEDLMGHLLRGDPDALEDAKHIRATTPGLVLESAARRTGFILGFEYCRDLIITAALKKGGPS